MFENHIFGQLLESYATFGVDQIQVSHSAFFV